MKNDSRLRRLVWLLVVTVMAVASSAEAQDPLHIPIRWCTLEGTSAAENPACTCALNTKNALWLRHLRTSQENYLPFCTINLRSAANQAQLTFPVIADPCDPTDDATCPGVQGDIVFDAQDRDANVELNDAWQSCLDAWNSQGVASIGLMGLNVRRFLEDDAGAAENGILGVAGVPSFSDSAEQMALGVFSVIDYDFKMPEDACNAPPSCEPLDGIADPTDVTTGHEAGHSLSLPHLPSPPLTMMFDFFPQFDVVTQGGAGATVDSCPSQVPQPTSQCGQLRLQSLCHVPGVQITPGGLTGDDFALTSGDVAAQQIDLLNLALIDDRPLDEAIFSWRTAGNTAEAAGVWFFEVALDLDDNPATGGSPRDVGIQIPFPGAELVGQVEVRVAGTPASGYETATTQHLLRFDRTRFQPVADAVATISNLRYVVDFMGSAEPSATFTSGALITLRFDRKLLGKARNVRFQARASDREGRRFDLSPVGRLFLAPPELPRCRARPERLQPGKRFHVLAEGLPPDSSTRVLMGTRSIARGSTDAAGRTRHRVHLPEDTSPGRHWISVTVDDADTAVTADCSIMVRPVRQRHGDS